MNKSEPIGQVFTEYNDASYMLSLYKNDITKSKILEPSFGNGEFLKIIVEKIINQSREKKLSTKKIKNLLENNIYGYEINKQIYKIAIKNLNKKINDLNFKSKINWKNLKNDSIFNMKKKNFDLIIGNPPYVRIQNFNDDIHKIKNQLSRVNGNTDLFLMFIDFLLDKLEKKGNFIFIVPNSLGKSKSAKMLRKYLIESGSLLYIDYESEQLFSKVSVYSCIFHYIKNSDEESHFMIGKSRRKYKYKMINYKTFEPKKYSKNIIADDLKIRNGIATLADDIFIFSKNKTPNIEKQYLYKIIKASRSNEDKIAIFPYKIYKNSVISFKNENEIKKKAPFLYKYLLKNKARLKNRALEKKGRWFEYGRSQAIKNIMSEKWLIDTIIKPGQKKLEIKKLGKKTLVYSGLYTTSDKILNYNNSKLIKWLRFKSKDMRGGYKKISSSLFKRD